MRILAVLILALTLNVSAQLVPPGPGGTNDPLWTPFVPQSGDLWLELTNVYWGVAPIGPSGKNFVGYLGTLNLHGLVTSSNYLVYTAGALQGPWSVTTNLIAVSSDESLLVANVSPVEFYRLFGAHQPPVVAAHLIGYEPYLLFAEGFLCVGLLFRLLS